jgi:hypothetical protein
LAQVPKQVHWKENAANLSSRGVKAPLCGQPCVGGKAAETIVASFPGDFAAAMVYGCFANHAG